jgi:hypothetical protein
MSTDVDMTHHNPCDRDLVQLKLAQCVSDVFARGASPANEEKAMIGPSGYDRSICGHEDWRGVYNDDVIL